MSDRVLNFSEFFTKYSSDKEKNLDDFTASSSNFETGFDETTYDQKPIGPNRPATVASEMTPPSPGQPGAPAFSSSQEEEMNAPEETEEPSKEESAEESEEELEDEDGSEDVPEPEAGANPKKKKDKTSVEESRHYVKGFAQFVNETYYGTYPLDEEPKENEIDFDEFCPDCGEEFDEFGATCGCNM